MQTPWGTPFRATAGGASSGGGGVPRPEPPLRPDAPMGGDGQPAPTTPRTAEQHPPPRNPTHTSIHRIHQKPPPWTPEENEKMPLEKWTFDVDMWSMNCGLPEEQWGPAVYLEIGGLAQDFLYDHLEVN